MKQPTNIFAVNNMNRAFDFEKPASMIPQSLEVA